LARNVGMGEFQIGPSLTGFQQKLRAGLSRIRANKDVTINPDFTQANAQIRAWTNAPRRDIRIGVRVDDRELNRFEQRFTRIEHVFKQSDLRRGIRVNIAVAGAAALPALAQGALSAAAALTQLGQAALALPGIFSGLGVTIGTLLVGFKGLGDAFSSAGDHAEDAATSTKNYNRAAKDFDKAQRDMRKAVRDANREIEDQGQALRDVWLDQEQAAINVQKAIEALKEPADSASDYRQRVLDLNRALSEHTRINREAQRTANDATETLAGGATQTDTFRNAIDNLTEATANLAEAQKEISKGGSEFAEAMAKLGPNAQDFVNKVRSLAGAWGELQKAVSDKALAGVGDAIVELANRRLPLLQAGMERVASAWNGVFKDVLGNIGENANSNRIAQIFENVGRAVDTIRPGIDAFVDAFIHLSEVGSRFLPRLGEAFNSVMARFEAFVNRADSDGSLEKWIDQGLKVIGLLGDSLLSVGSILNSVTEAYQEATGNIGGFAQTMADGLGRLAEYLKSPRGRKALVDYIKEAKLFLSNIKEAIPGILSAFQAIGDAARAFAQVIFPVFARVGQFMEDHKTLVQSLLMLYLGFRTVKPFFNAWTKGWDRVDAAAARYQARMEQLKSDRALLSTAPAVTRQLEDRVARADIIAARAVAADEKNAAAMAATQKRLDAANAAVAKSHAALLSANASRGVSTDPARGRSAEMRAYKADLAAVAAAQKELDKNIAKSDKTMRTANSTVTQAQTAHSVLARHVNAVDQAAARTATPAGGIAKMRNAIGNGVGKAASGLVGSVGSLVAGLGTTVAIGTALWAVTTWGEVNADAADAVTRHKDAVDALANSLSENTGAANEATQAQIVDNLMNATNTATGQSYGNVLQGQPVDANALATAINQGDRARVDELLRPIREQAFGYVNQNNPGGTLIDSSIVGRALAGDRAATEDYKQRLNIPGISDSFQQFLDISGIAETTDLADIMKGLPEGTRRQFELLQTVESQLNNREQAIGQRQGQIYATYGGARLLPGNPFGPGADVSAGPNRSATVAVSPEWLAAHPELAKNIEANGGQRGLNRADGKVEFWIDPERAKKYVEFGQFAAGGAVSGRGSGTSDSIPAWLSNGEYVLNAASAKMFGPDFLHWMNNAPKFNTGGGWWKNDIIKPPTPSPTSIIPALGGLPSRAPLGPSNNPLLAPYTPRLPQGGPGVVGQLQGVTPIKPAPSTGRSTFDKLKEDPELPLGLGVLDPMRFQRPPGSAIPDRRYTATDRLLAPFNTGLTPPKPATNTFYSQWYQKPKPKPPAVTRIPDAPHQSGNFRGVTATGPATGVGAGRPPGPAGGGVAPTPMAPVAGMAPNMMLPLGPGGRTGPETGLQVNTIRLKRAIEQAFPEIATIGGYRQDALRWHPSGLALDVTVGDDKALGDRVKAWVEANGAQFGFRGFETGESIWRDGGAHEDHLHLVTTGGGYPGPEGIPANAMAPIFDPRTGQIGLPGMPGQQVLPPQGSGPFGLSLNGNRISGPFGELPVQPLDLAKSIGDIFVQAIASIFGIDLSGILGIINKITGDPAVERMMNGGGPGNYTPSEYMEGYFSGQPKPFAAEGYIPGAGAEQWRPLVEQVFDAYGPGLGLTNKQAWVDALVRQIDTESKGDPGAENPNDSNGQGGTQSVSGLLQFLESTFDAHNISGGLYKDPVAQIAAALDYVSKKYGVDANGAPLRIGQGVGYRDGGMIRGPGSATSDSIPAWLSNGEYVLNAKATKFWGHDTLAAMNAQRFNTGGPVIPLLPFAPVGAAGQMAQGVFSASTQPSNPATGEALGAAGQAAAAAFSPKGSAGGGARAGQRAMGGDPRGELMAGPATNDHLNPAFRGIIEGGFNTAGALAGTAAALGMGALNGAAPGAGSAAGGAASQAISAGFQMAGKVASGAANVLSSLLVGTVTPASTGQGYGQPLLPQAPQPRQFQSIHNGNVYTSDMNEYTRTQERMAAQRAAGWMNRF
jgi:hypothetical protein